MAPSSTRASALADAVRLLGELACDVAADAVVVPRRGLDQRQSHQMVRDLRDREHRSVMVGLTDTPNGPQTTIVGADAELTDLARMMAEIAEEDPSRRATADPAPHERPLAVAAQSAGVQPLSVVAPEVFANVVVGFQDALKAALEQRAYRVTRNVNRHLMDLAGQLAELHADPRDCVEAQLEVINAFAPGQPAVAVAAAREEATVLLLELVGYLARAYRDGRHGGDQL